jgi:hypothetical protein
MNEHAIVVWEYLVETVRRCKGKAAVDYQFTRLILDMGDAYPNEFEYVLRNFVMED